MNSEVQQGPEGANNPLRERRMTLDLEATLRDALARATAGDWKSYKDGVHPVLSDGSNGNESFAICQCFGPDALPNQRFIALAKNHMGDLLDTLTALRAQVEAKDAALREAREIIQTELDHLLSCCCLTGDDGKPIRETLEDGPSETVLGMEASISNIDATLESSRG